MNEAPLENFLALLYTEPEMQARFLADPASEARRFGLSSQHCAAVLQIDPIQLRLAARSFAHKRHKRAAHPPKAATFIQRLVDRVRHWRSLLPAA